MILPDRVLGRSYDHDGAGFGDGPDLFGHVLAELLDHVGAAAVGGLAEDDERLEGIPTWTPGDVSHTCTPSLAGRLRKLDDGAFRQAAGL